MPLPWRSSPRSKRSTVHDVKAVEYYIGRRLPAIGVENLTALVHFGCTSEDINNLSYALGIKGAVEDVWLPAAEGPGSQDRRNGRGQPQPFRCSPAPTASPPRPPPWARNSPSSPTGWAASCDRIDKTEYLGKINGATGTYAAHYASVPGGRLAAGLAQFRARAWA